MKRGVVVQEITADGRCVEHIHELPLVVDPVQDRINNLPEFRRMREQSLKSAAEILEDNDAMLEKEKQAELEQEMSEINNEEANFRRQIEREEKETEEEGRNIKKREKAEFDDAMKERNSTESFAPKLKVRILEKKKDAKPSRPEPVFIRKKPKGTPEQETERKLLSGTPGIISKEPAAAAAAASSSSKEQEGYAESSKKPPPEAESKKEVPAAATALPFGQYDSDSDSD